MPAIIPIIVVAPNEPTPGVAWESVAQFQQVYFMARGAHASELLLKANAEGARQVLIIPDSSMMAGEEGRSLALQSTLTGTTGWGWLRGGLECTLCHCLLMSVCRWVRTLG